MGQLAQRVRASLHKYRLVWLVILVGAVPAPPAHRRGERGGGRRRTRPRDL